MATLALVVALLALGVSALNWVRASEQAKVNTTVTNMLGTLTARVGRMEADAAARAADAYRAGLQGGN